MQTVKRHWLVTLAIAANLLVAAAATLSFGQRLPRPAGAILGAVLLLQGDVLAIWAALCGKPTPWRLVGVVFGILLWIWTIGWLERHHIWF